jgi:hypothetical protein
MDDIATRSELPINVFFGQCNCALVLFSRVLRYSLKALTSGPHYLYRLRPGAKACLNYGKPVAH